MPNQLAESTSPYLRQHQDNPVDWFPWCDEAFRKAEREDKTVFLSVGYSACHWCHVMEHESFENDDIAAILNEHFVSIKVDREERPDVDQIYMQAVQMLCGSGGWPMSVFMSHDGHPFYGGTYWPPDNRFGRPGFGQVLLAVAEAWKNKRDQIVEQGRQITEHLQSACRGPASSDSALTEEWINAAETWLLRNHDTQHGGFGGAPKFPHAMDLSLLVELSADDPDSERTQVVATTLDKMARGGIYDHLGGGFARYSVDERWLVPHFEKMLYDNALLASVYADAYRLWNIPEYAQVVRETLDYVLRDMTNELGGYHSTEDADSEGVEGKFYVWTSSEIQEVLGAERARQFCDCYDVTEQGNFEGSNILNLPKSVRAFAQLYQLGHEDLERQLADDRAKLLARREKRIRPALDDKVLLSWNALMIGAMVRGYRALGDPRYLDSARKAVRFLTGHMRRRDGRFWHTWRAGTSSLNAYLDDYAYFVDALVELFCVDANAEYLELAVELAELLIKEFRDPDGGFYFTAADHERLIARSKDLADSSVPGGNAMAASGLLTLARLTGRNDFREAAESALIASSGVMAASPQAAGQALRVLHRFLRPSQEIVLIHSDDDPDATGIVAPLLHRLAPCSIALVCHETGIPVLQPICSLLQQRKLVDQRATLFVCEDSVCKQPLTGSSLLQFLKDAVH